MSKINKDDLLKEAIAEAKQVRSTAFENAKLALQEAFTPQLQSMLSAKLRNEMEGDFGKDDTEGEIPTGFEGGQDELNPALEKEVKDVTATAGNDPEKGKAGDIGPNSGGQGLEDQGGGKKVYEAEGDEEEEIPGETPEDSITAPGEDMPVPGDNGEEVPPSVGDEFGGEEEDEDDAALEAVIKELEAEDEIPSAEDPFAAEENPEEKVPVEQEAKDVTDIASQDPEQGLASDVGPNSGSETAIDTTPTTGQDTVGTGEEDEIELESLVKEIESEIGNGEEEEEEKMEMENLRTENKSLKESIKKHREVVTYLRDKLNEINLLNSKLLYTNRLFRSANLTENQKLRVVESIDRANNVREVKLVYATLAESLKMKKTVVTESKKKPSLNNTPSAPGGSTKPTKEINQTVISEGKALAERFKFLAGTSKKIARIL